jgi:hypothetical protein
VNKEFTNYWKEVYGDNLISISDKGEITYKDENGDKKTITRENAMREYAGAAATKEMSKKLEALPKAIDKALARNQKSGVALSNFFNDE